MSVVKFQNNVIDATEMVGGYTSWNLVPNGPLIVPANQKSPSIPLNATALECYKPDRNFDLYLPNADVNYDSGEVVTLTGPVNGEITMKGQVSGKTSTWDFKVGTAPK